MSIQVSNHGKIIDREVRYEVACNSCGTTFTYQYEDVEGFSRETEQGGVEYFDGVNCPNGECGGVRRASKHDFLRDRPKGFFESLFG